MPLPIKIALIKSSPRISPGDLARCAAAVQLQVTRDVAPLWGLPPVVVAAFPRPKDVPAAYWHVTVRGKKPGDQNWLGYHSLAENGQPVAWILDEDGWQTTVSHEVIEACVDPYGSRLVAGPHPTDPRIIVQYLVEACDPPEGFSYSVGGVDLSDFLTPHYYDAVVKPHTHYSFLGKLPGPRTLADGGYLSFFQPGKGWWQWEAFRGGTPNLHSLGARTREKPLREWLDQEARRICREAKAA